MRCETHLGGHSVDSFYSIPYSGYRPRSSALSDVGGSLLITPSRLFLVRRIW
uniref:Uncharacterized protein n=1 Tax=Salmonella phage vB_STmST313_KE31 TaxID=3161181 RepID=A0AAU8GJ65_9CAUD